NGGVISATAQLYDPATGAWSSAGMLGVSRTSFRAVLLSTGRVLVAGGKNTATNSLLASAELYDPNGTPAATATPAAPSGPPTNSAWLRSPTAFVQRTLAARATFGAGPWQHVGFAADGFGDRWAIVSTAGTSTTLYARTFDGGSEQRTALPGLALGVPHDLR